LPGLPEFIGYLTNSFVVLMCPAQSFAKRKQNSAAKLVKIGTAER